MSDINIIKAYRHFDSDQGLRFVIYKSGFVDTYVVVCEDAAFIDASAVLWSKAKVERVFADFLSDNNIKLI